MGNVSDKMYDGLWLGERMGVTHTTDRVLEKLNIDIVITAQSQREVDAAKLQTFLEGRKWHHFVLEDTDEEEIGEYFEEVHAILHAAKQAGKRVYVHCAAGISRSPTLVAAHLMLENNWSRKTAIEYISKRRPCIDPNSGFMNQLKILEDQIRRRLEADGRSLDDAGSPNSSDSVGGPVREEAHRTV